VTTPNTGSSALIGSRQVAKFGVLIAIYAVVVFLIPRPETVRPEGWRLFGLFLATIGGLILQPMAGAAIVLLGVTLSAMLGGLTMSAALAGWSDTSVWLVVAAFMISRSLMNTGLARRIALFFVRTFGKTSLGVCYSLAASDWLLASIIPSNGARSGGVILPIVRSISELYGSKPGPTAGVIGTFLFVTMYQCVCISSAMFFTGQASNPLAAGIATKAGYPITWASWFAAGIVPGLLSLIATPLVVRLFLPPGVQRTPEAAEFARGELLRMGPLSAAEKVLVLVFVGVCLGWATSGTLHRVDVTMTALLGSCVLLISGILTWEDVKSEKTLWDIFIWYGGLVMLARALNDAGVTQAFAKGVGSTFSGMGWPSLFAIALVIYFYAHYAFASITAHILSMYTPFLAVLVAQGAPIGLVAIAFATFVNFSAGLTHYGTTPSPMYFSVDYVSMKDWWKIGFIVSVMNLAIWGTVGFMWWKMIGIW
jgi:DASS family divalent anion:Na+ symporter